MVKTEKKVYFPLPDKFKWIYALELNGVKYYNTNYAGRSING